MGKSLEKAIRNGVKHRHASKVLAILQEVLGQQVMENFTSTEGLYRILRSKVLVNSSGQTADTTLETFRTRKCTAMEKCHGLIKNMAQQRIRIKATCLQMLYKVTVS